MQTEVLKLTQDNMDKKAILKAAQIIRGGGLIGLPTETVYGLAGNCEDEEAAQKIFKAKGRPQDNPLIIHICEKNEIYKYAKNISHDVQKIMDAFWPGPLTIIVEKRDIVPDVVSCNLPTVAVRMPSHEGARAIIKACGVALAAPSANLSGRPSPTTAAHVYEDLAGKIPLIIDGGMCHIGLESTVVDMSFGEKCILRPGGVSIEMLREILPDFKGHNNETALPNDGVAVKSPGMKYKHYAPKAPVTLFKGDVESIINCIINRAKMAEKKVGILCFSEVKDKFCKIENAVVIDLGSKDNLEEIAHNLFASLRSLDEEIVFETFAMCPKNAGIGVAIENRLNKAASFNIINL